MELLTIEEVIQHCNETTEKMEYIYKKYDSTALYEHMRYREHKQVAEWLKELKRYKELEEAGRLMILPKDYDKEMFKKENCPGILGLKESCHIDADCDECWEAALKDGESE